MSRRKLKRETPNLGPDVGQPYGCWAHKDPYWRSAEYEVRVSMASSFRSASRVMATVNSDHGFSVRRKSKASSSSAHVVFAAFANIRDGRDLIPGSRRGGNAERQQTDTNEFGFVEMTISTIRG